MVAVTLVEVLETADVEVVVINGDGVSEGGFEEVNKGAFELPLVEGGGHGRGAMDGEAELDAR